MKLLADFQKVVGLPPEERRLLMLTAVLVPVTSVGLRILGCRRYSSLLVAASRSCRKTQQIDDQARSVLSETLARIVQAAEGRMPWRITCLERSLVLWFLFNFEGVEARVQFGVRKSAGRFQAHAWVEHPAGILDESHGAEDPFPPFDQPLVGGSSAPR